jgi:Sec-independent protein secretion pathway component TatC
MDLDQKISTLEMKAKLSTLWIFVLLNMIFRDLHEFGRPGFLEEVMTGIVNGVQITEGLLLLGGIMIEVPIAMVLLSQLLKVRVNRWANIIAGTITIALVLVNNTAPDLDDMFFTAIEVVALSLIIWYAWRWPKQTRPT